MPPLVVQIKVVCFNLFGYVSEHLNKADLRMDNNISPPNVESGGGVSMDIFLFNFPAWLFWRRRVRTSIDTPWHFKACSLAYVALKAFHFLAPNFVQFLHVTITPSPPFGVMWKHSRSVLHLGFLMLWRVEDWRMKLYYSIQFLCKKREYFHRQPE